MNADTLWVDESPQKPARQAELVYESESAALWLGDARDVLADIPKESTHLILTDPPYGVEWRSNQRAERFSQLVGDGASEDERAIVREVLRHCVRIVGQNRHLYVFGPSDVLDGQKVSEVVELIWDKGTLGSGDVTSVWGPQHERVSFCTSKFRHAGQTGGSGVPTRLRKGSILRFTRPTGRKVRHPSEKPVPLLTELIESSSRRGELIVDPFAGVGSTGVAAILSGRRALLVEKDPQWIPIAVERLKRAEHLSREEASA
ncbi:DNA methyltransferase [Microbacterium sp. H37-C3]|uniref:DNA-methyltransferase n=1 Tax=Microbacterium sp. H37-C3 TaxID=3004354 RepID=UPI0022AE89B3|nr:DNA methyltransferase [Microbacterium sp. H37-C3]MCZ4069239.1 DNA methyltransferase [Microbacterium sp. H37-C3]